jgi:hypothetical protein
MRVHCLGVHAGDIRDFSNCFFGKKMRENLKPPLGKSMERIGNAIYMVKKKLPAIFDINIYFPCIIVRTPLTRFVFYISFQGCSEKNQNIPSLS